MKTIIFKFNIKTQNEQRVRAARGARGIHEVASVTSLCLYGTGFPRAFLKRPLDYKPDAKKTDKTAAEQLFLYALALSKRSGIPMRKIACAYFDENNYFQLSPG